MKDMGKVTCQPQKTNSNQPLDKKVVLLFCELIFKYLFVYL